MAAALTPRVRLMAVCDGIRESKTEAGVLFQKASDPMKKKAPKNSRKPTLHKSVLVPITDPAIQAAIDQMARMENPVVPEILREHARRTSRKGK